MSYLEGDHHDQELLLPESSENYVSEDNPVRFIDGFVDKLDLAECGFIEERSSASGRPSYAPADILKLYLYGYTNRTRSSRMLERACHINMEVIWLIRRLKPDHKTIAEFRRKYPKGIKQISDTDEDSRAMAKNPRIALGYNAQASADEANCIVVAEDLSNDVHDYDQLEPMARQSKENLGDPDHLNVTADKGYDKASAMVAVEEMGCHCHVPGRRNSSKGAKYFTKDAFRYLKGKDAYRCPAGKLLPRRYESVVDGRKLYTYWRFRCLSRMPVNG